MIRAYIRYECPVCGHHVDVRVRVNEMVCSHPDRAVSRPATMTPKALANTGTANDAQGGT